MNRNNVKLILIEDVLFDFIAVSCYTDCNFTDKHLKDYNGSKLLFGYCRELAGGASRCGREKAVSLLS